MNLFGVTDRLSKPERYNDSASRLHFYVYIQMLEGTQQAKKHIIISIIVQTHERRLVAKLCQIVLTVQTIGCKFVV